MTDFDESDIAAMRVEGSLRDFLRMQSRPTRQPDKPPPRPPWKPPGHVPGQWPAGCQRPAPPLPVPAAVWTAALAEYRAWLASGQAPHMDQPDDEEF